VRRVSSDRGMGGEVIGCASFMVRSSVALCERCQPREQFQGISSKDSAAFVAFNSALVATS
jgi:hypothetical protein